MDIPEDVIDEAEDLYWDRSGENHGLGCAQDAYEHVAEWARKVALKEAERAIIDCGYVLDSDVIGFPSGQAVDRHEVVNAVRALGEAIDGQT